MIASCWPFGLRKNRAPPWRAAAWRRFGPARSAASLASNPARSARGESGAGPPHSKEASEMLYWPTIPMTSILLFGLLAAGANVLGGLILVKSGAHRYGERF